jgi:hypothetical protein
LARWSLGLAGLEPVAIDDHSVVFGLPEKKSACPA